MNTELITDAVITVDYNQYENCLCTLPVIEQCYDITIVKETNQSLYFTIGDV